MPTLHGVVLDQFFHRHGICLGCAPRGVERRRQQGLDTAHTLVHRSSVCIMDALLFRFVTLQIVVNLRTGYMQEGHFVNDDWLAAWTYLRTAFILDFFGSFPLNIVWMAIEPSNPYGDENFGSREGGEHRGSVLANRFTIRIHVPRIHVPRRGAALRSLTHRCTVAGGARRSIRLAEARLAIR